MFEGSNRRLTTVTAVPPVARELRPPRATPRRLDRAALPFKTIEDVERLGATIGQLRALDHLMTIGGKMLEGTMEGHDRKPRERAELGRRLAASEGYLVLASDGRHVGVVDHIRYEQHADHPDEIVVRRRNVLLRRRRAIAFDAVQAVDPRQHTVTLRIDSTALDRSNPP